MDPPLGSPDFLKFKYFKNFEKILKLNECLFYKPFMHCSNFELRILFLSKTSKKNQSFQYGEPTSINNVKKLIVIFKKTLKIIMSSTSKMLISNIPIFEITNHLFETF
ncbi:hypothetical protein EDEG_03211 [Edhazardia aedis USNM 41457]|uniref:Uncharacterized protein n=1 Tax=Edhazardia aedis (strain USNM 41457) TaxID=1003232 RepID=J9DLU3_EDHAE|nr:hypothetical protein EDEG_03211 [Edhazardia aedis USNM 41457]|eukprot:EJW02352.1 hypothetical protein EDEG_03211 [Edhazardia aedis USNM 41457]